jgi:hypothetical protein
VGKADVDLAPGRAHQFRRRYIMKKLLRSLVRNESGQGTLITVLVLLVLGALLTVPLLNFMSTGLRTVRVHDERTEEFYAADAGVEDALYKLVNNIEPPSNPYTLTDINGKEVQVSLPSQHDTMIDFFSDIGILDDPGRGIYNKNRPHAEWFVVYTPIENETGVYSEYRITVYYDKNPPKNVVSTGFWIFNYYGSTTLIPYNSTGEDAVVWVDLNGDGNRTADENITTDGPLIDGFVPPGEFREAEEGGTAFIWEWDHKDGPSFGKGVRCRTQRFALDPPIEPEEGEEFPPNVAWVEAHTDDILVSWFGSTGINCIISTAIDPYTLAQTTVKSYVFRLASGDIVVMTYEISL